MTTTTKRRTACDYGYARLRTKNVGSTQAYLWLCDDDDDDDDHDDDDDDDDDDGG